MMPTMTGTPLDERSVRLHFKAADDHRLEVDVRAFHIEESLAHGFVARVDFLSASGALLFDDVAGLGAAVSLRTAHLGERVWAGICSELTLVETQHDPDHPGNSAMRYRMTVRSPLHRLSLRTNSRIFQHLSTPEIVAKVLGEWDIDVEESRLVDAHPKHEFKVQYAETDLAFVTRLLEEEGITFWMSPAAKIPAGEKNAHALHHLVIDDQPNQRKPAFPNGDHPLCFFSESPRGDTDDEAHVWSLTASQRPIAGTFTVRGHDFRGRTDRLPSGDAVFAGGPDAAGETRYEQFAYASGAFWEDGGTGGDTPIADDRGTARTSANRVKDVPRRLLAAEVAQRTVTRFSTDALALEPGVVFAIGKDDPLFLFNHPHPSFGPRTNLLVTSRTIHGGSADYTSECTAVFAASEFRLPRTIPRPRIFGVQSAVVVGPTGQEIHTDEFGRVRVQFDWDREGNFDEQSSCWMRVSQGWAGGGFGSVALPRVGHEVLVSFFDGDPDRPVVVGRVFNASTNTPYFPATGRDKFGANATKTAIRTDTSPHGKGRAGYNELLFQDERGHEVIHVQAQRDLSFTVNAGEVHAVGGDVSFSVGASESHTVTRDLDFKTGGDESHVVVGRHHTLAGSSYLVTTNDNYSVRALGGIGLVSNEAMQLWTESDVDISARGAVSIGSQTGIVCDAPSFTIKVNGASLVMDKDGVKITTGGATLKLGPDTAALEGKAGATVMSGAKLTMSASGDTKIGGANVMIDGGEVLLNGASAPIVALTGGAAPSATTVGSEPLATTSIDPIKGGGRGDTQAAPFLPEEVATPPVAPGGFEEVVLRPDP